MPRPVAPSDKQPTRRQEPFAEKWVRRAVTIPLTGALALVCTLTLPLLLAVAVIGDLILRRRGALTRTLLLSWLLLLMESAGILAAFALWLARTAGLIRSRAEFEALHYGLQRWWGTTLARAGIRLFNMSLIVESEYVFGLRPIILFVRHTSSVDTLLPVYLLSRVYGLRLRYVLKRQLLWDPCLDIVGQRLPNVFVRRAGDLGRETALLSQLAAGAQLPNEGVLIYPEGTRFTTEKQTAVRRTWDKKNPALAGYAHALQHVLPVRPAGAVALLQGNPHADAVFCVHAGFEGVATLQALLRGCLVDAVVRVFFFSVPAADIPADPASQADWLRGQWLRVDQEVARLKGDANHTGYMAHHTGTMQNENVPPTT